VNRPGFDKLIFLVGLAVLVCPIADTASSTIESVKISAPSYAHINQPVQVRALIKTNRTGYAGTSSQWYRFVIYHVQAELTLPDNASMVSGDAKASIGTMAGGTAANAVWAIAFQNAGSYEIEVHVTGLDKDGVPCRASDRTVIVVSNDSSSPLGEGSPFPLAFVMLLATVAVVIGALLVWQYKIRNRHSTKQNADAKIMGAFFISNHRVKTQA